MMKTTNENINKNNDDNVNSLSTSTITNIIDGNDYDDDINDHENINSNNYDKVNSATNTINSNNANNNVSRGLDKYFTCNHEFNLKHTHTYIKEHYHNNT